MKVQIAKTNQPQWKTVTVKSHIPTSLKKLDEIAHNLWWAWNSDARDLFKSLDPDLWRKVGKNPIELLAAISYKRLKEMETDPNLISQMNKVYGDFRAYMDVKPDSNRASVAYFCMEYGISHVLKIYSGGLGVLAGDYLKEASDSNVDLCAVGFLYRYGYFTQSLSMDGQQIAEYKAENFDNLPVERVLDENGNQVVIDVPFPNYTVYASLWRANVGRISLYLLDTDNGMNSEYDRNITHALYGGEWENRIKQEYLLGIGGMLALKRLGIKKDIYHCNEGHAALCNVQRLVDYVAEGLNFTEALELVRASSLYTVHTPVPAGHDYFEEGLFAKYMNQYPEKLGITWDDFMGLGRTNPEDKGEKFCMSTFLCKTCQDVNGVSWLHGKVSQNMFNGIWKGYFPSELHVNYVTNGVHMPTWADEKWKKLYDKYFDKNFLADQSNESIWSAIQKVSDEEIWEVKTALKKRLYDFIKVKYKESWMKNQGDPKTVMSIMEKIRPNALTIGFGRRFATYKRAHLLFTDLDRLNKILNNPEHPVKFLFAGKAHPADGAGQGLIKRIYEISQRPEFLGKIIFLEDYDMLLARRLVSGVDIWMNTPTRPLEASGTSGEKAEMNGVVNLSVLDGWWLEGYREGAGWALTEKRTYQNQGYQDQLDATTIYNMLENEIIPLYYNKNSKGYSEDWIRVVKNSIAQIAPHYTMKRQLDDYYDKFYNRMSARFLSLSANNNALAKDIAQWKETVAERWDAVHVVSVERNFPEIGAVAGQACNYKVVVDEQGLDNAVGVELVVLNKTADITGRQLRHVIPFNVTAINGNLYTFECEHRPQHAGEFKLGLRLYPKNANLPCRMDFCYVKWID